MKSDVKFDMLLHNEVYFCKIYPQDNDWPLRKRQGPVPVPILHMHFTCFKTTLYNITITTLRIKILMNRL